MMEPVQQLGPGHAYALVALGAVLGAVGVIAAGMWKRALAARERERYFADVNGLARGAK